MPTGQELEDFITDRIDKETNEMLELVGGGGNHDDREAESPEELGVMGKCCGSHCVPCKNVLQD